MIEFMTRTDEARIAEKKARKREENEREDE